jgi:hypothetical protein
LLEPDVSVLVEMHTVWRFVVTVVAEVNGQAVTISFLSVTATEYVMVFGLYYPLAD